MPEGAPFGVISAAALPRPIGYLFGTTRRPSRLHIRVTDLILTLQVPTSWTVVHFRPDHSLGITVLERDFGAQLEISSTSFMHCTDPRIPTHLAIKASP